MKMKNIIVTSFFVLLHWSYAATQLADRAAGAAELFKALDHRNEAEFRILIENGTNANITDDTTVKETPMHVASLMGLEESVKLLINRGYRHQIYIRDTYGRTPLHNAVQNGHLNVIRLLIQNGSEINEKDNDGFTAIHIAAYFGRPNVTNLLIQSGSNVNEKLVDGQNALSLAAQFGHLNVTNLLIQNGGEINEKDKNGWTALHFAAKNGHKDVAEVLIDSGADIYAENNDGKNPRDIAVQFGHTEFVDWLDSKQIPMIEAGIDPSDAPDNETKALFDFLNDLGTEDIKSQNDSEKKLIPMTTEPVTDTNDTTDNVTENVTDIFNGLGTEDISSQNKSEGILIPASIKSVPTPTDVTDYQSQDHAYFEDFLENDSEIKNKTDANQTTENPTTISTIISRKNLLVFPDECQTVCSEQSMDLPKRQLAKAEELSWMATLGYLNDTFSTIEHGCGGAIISEEFILTSAHCVDESNLPLIVRVGVLSLNGKSLKTYRIKEIIRHEDYSSITKKNDIALIRLMKKIECTPNIRPACLETDLHDLSPNMRLNVTGWGTRSPDKIIGSNDIINAEVITLPLSWCKSIYLDYNKNTSQATFTNGISESQYCAWESSGRTDTCWGEGGGPLQFARYPNTSYIVGIVSFDIECGKWPTIYTRVAHYLHWITSHVWPQKVYRVSASYKITDIDIK